MITVVVTSGIYQIQSICKPNRKYIGSTVDIKKRWKRHQWELKNGIHTNQKLQRHYNKYGKEDLCLTVLLGCSKENLLEIEQYFIEVLNPVFNICKIAGSHLGRKCSHESIERMRIAKSKISDETRKKISDSAKARGWPNRLKKMTESAKNKIRLSALGNKYNLGHKRTDATKLKMSISMKGKGVGRKHTEEIKQKIREAHLGQKNFFYGKKHTLETRIKISKSCSLTKKRNRMKKLQLL